MTCSSGFLENFYKDYAGDVRTLEMTNMKARAVGSSEWEDADFVTVMINGSVGIGEDEYTGSANFGADDASFWAITSGVPGIGRETEPEEIFALQPGESGDPTQGLER